MGQQLDPPADTACFQNSLIEHKSSPENKLPHLKERSHRALSRSSERRTRRPQGAGPHPPAT
jgi:hypothetical protein